MEDGDLMAVIGGGNSSCEYDRSRMKSDFAKCLNGARRALFGRLETGDVAFCEREKNEWKLRRLAIKEFHDKHFLRDPMSDLLLRLVRSWARIHPQ